MFEFKLSKTLLRMPPKTRRREKEKKFRLTNGSLSLDIYKASTISQIARLTDRVRILMGICSRKLVTNWREKDKYIC